ncbi:MAG: DUF975 family protein [Oscillospiraceae bacterium]|nr:DUF975 family protein [Oscillospiraceae bacterium]
MKYAADFRAIARGALRGKWSTAVLTGFIAALIGATIGTGSSSSVELPEDWQTNPVFQPIFPLLLTLASFLTVYAIIVMIIGGAGKLGYATFNLNLVDGKPAALSDLFSQFYRFGDGFCMNLLVGLYTALWSLLFIIPGLIKIYSYSMTPYILAEHPEMSVNEAITESRRMMDGNKGRLFCLELSFIGWSLLILLPMFLLIPLVFIGAAGAILWLLLGTASAIVGGLFLRPYTEAARAAFYREVSGTEQAEAPATEEAYDNY